MISPAQVTDGTTAKASDVNNPINTIANEFNGNIDNTNIKGGAAIATAKLASDAGITGAMLGPTAIKLAGTADIVAAQNGITTEVDVTGMSQTITQPAGGRDLILWAHFSEITTSVNTQRAHVRFKEGSTALGGAYILLPSTSGGNGRDVFCRVAAPSAGSHTYKVTIVMDVGAGTIGVFGGAIPDQSWLEVLAI